MADRALAPIIFPGSRDGPANEEQPRLPFQIPADWGPIPTSKVRRPRKGEPFGWAYTYTSFSVGFAKAILERLDTGSTSVVIDPFVGSGSTLIAATLCGSSMTGIDINPFSVLLSRSRVATAPDWEVIQWYLQPDSLCGMAESVTDTILSSDDMSYARAVVQRMCHRRRKGPQELFETLLADDQGDYDSETISLLSLAIGARSCANLARGSNPIWYRSVSDTPDNRRMSLRSTATKWSEVITSDLTQLPQLTRPGQRIINCDMSSIERYSRKFDVCLTSPPYLNRLDYVVASLPELSVLSIVTTVDINYLRKQMIGTTKVIEKYGTEVPLEWGSICKSSLDAIGMHDSYASRRYYYHTIYHYFKRLYEAFSVICLLMKSNGRGVIVLQNSFYKNLIIPTAEIAAEMLRGLSFKASVVRTTAVRQHMGQLSPVQTSYAPRKILHESLVYFAQ